MKVTKTKDKIIMIAAIIDPHSFTLWAAYLEDRMSEGKSFEEAIKMADYNYEKNINLAANKAELILKLLEDYNK